MISIQGFTLKTFQLITMISFVSGDTSKHDDIEEKLKLLNKPAIKSIQSEDGDIIDCVDVYKQPAFNHPSLQNHTIQIKPRTASTHKQNSTRIMVSQLWQRSGSCPKGTIPIRRIKRDDLLRSQSLHRFGRKNPTVSSRIRRRKKNKQRDTDQNNGSDDMGDLNDVYFNEVNHSTAIILAQGFSFSGAKADLNVWNPYVEFEDEYSSGQIWLRNGPWYDFESIESGWIVNPSVYGDRRTRLFVYWTADASKETGCFDLTCSGFVQTSDKIALGSVIDPVSYPGPYQYQITLYIYKDFDTNNWWLQYGDDVDIGYWPAELFGVLNHQANLVKWGGQVYSSRIGKPRHTGTDMGSGSVLRRYGYGCYVRQIRIRDNSLMLKYPQFVDSWMDEYNCYWAFLNWEYMTDPEFYYGGPGRNPICP